MSQSTMPTEISSFVFGAWNFWKVVAREGSAPPTSGCRPDAMLFHHRAEIGCRGWNCTSIRAFKGRCPTIRRPGNELVEPEVVATSPNRIKSPVPVCCGFSSEKNGGRERTCTSKARRLSICGVCYSRLTTRPKNTQIGASRRCRPGTISLQKKSAGCCQEA